MGLISRVLSYTRVLRGSSHVADVKIRPDGAAPMTIEHNSAPGDDSPPLASDFVAAMEVEGTGRGVAVGYVDPKNAGVAVPGEKRIYARDASGAIVSEYHGRLDGSVEVKNGAGSFILTPDGALEASVTGLSIRTLGGSITLDAGGNVTINGVTIDPLGNITSPATIAAVVDVVGAGKSLATHAHVGSPTAPTGPQTPTGPPQ